MRKTRNELLASTSRLARLSHEYREDTKQIRSVIFRQYVAISDRLKKRK
jgi:hypothetical protein